MKVAIVGLDIAKHVFQLHGTDRDGKVVLRRKMRRHEVVPFFANLASCVVGLEACGGAHYWARRLTAAGHAVRMIAPQFVKPFVKSNKNDANDAEAICEAAGRPSMRFVSAKSVEQQDIQSLHRVRSRLVSCRTQLVNQLRGLLMEYGIVLPQHVGRVRRGVPESLEDESNEPPLVGGGCSPFAITVGWTWTARSSRSRRSCARSTRPASRSSGSRRWKTNGATPTCERCSF